MYTTYPQQIECVQHLHDKLYNWSLTNPQQFDNPQRVYDKSTTRLYNKSNVWSLSITEIAHRLAKMSEYDKNCSNGNVPWGMATQFRR